MTYTKSGNSWSTTSKVFWPQTGNVTFYAFSPASNSAVTFDTSNKQLKYTAPTAQGSQQDVLYAYATSSRPTSNTVNLTFNHANAAFSVSAQLATGCTATVNVSGVKLVNVMPTNTLTVSSGSASASGSNISTDVAINSTTLTTTAATISSSPLMLPPQSVTAWSGTSTLANTYLAVTCKVSENDNYVVGSSSTTGTVYVPMGKTLTKGQDNSVNLVFGTLSDGKRSYGRDANGNRITISISKDRSEITASDVGKVICTDGTVFNTVSDATSAGKTPAGMIAYVNLDGTFPGDLEASRPKIGMAISLSDNTGYITDNSNPNSSLDNYNQTLSVDAISYYTDYNKGWVVPTSDEWRWMIEGCGGSVSDDDFFDDEFVSGHFYNEFDATSFRQYLRDCGANDVKDDKYWTATGGSWSVADGESYADYYDFGNNHFTNQPTGNYAYFRFFFYFGIE